MLQMGPSLFISLPPGDDALREQCIRDLAVDVENVRVQQPGEEPSLALVCVAPNDEAAQAIEEEILGLMHAPAPRRLIPPWVKDDPRTPAERDLQTRARRTYHQINAVDWTSDNPALTANVEAIRTATRLGDTKRAEELRAENEKIREKARNAKLAALKADPRSVQAVFERIEAVGPTPEWSDEMSEEDFDRMWAGHTKRLEDELMPLLGQIDTADPKADALTRAAVQTGGMQRTGLLIHVQYLTLNHPPDGLPALVEWLHARGCIDVRAQWHAFTDPWASVVY